MRLSHRCLAWLPGAARLARVVAVAVVLPLPSPSAHAEAPAGLAVVGIVIPDSGVAMAAIEDRATARTQLYRVGDSVNDGVITAIAPDRVTLAFAGQSTLIRLAIYVGGAPGGAAAAGGPAGGPSASRARGQAIADSGRSDPPRGVYGHLGEIMPNPAHPGSPGVGGGLSGGGTGSRGGTTGGTTGGSGRGGTAGTASAATLRFTGVLHTGTEQSGGEFSGQSLRDLLISVSHTNLSATGQRVELSTPDGSLYQRYSGAAPPASQVRVPIGGTWITEHGLFGAWTVRVYFDRDPTPAVTGGFILNR